MIQQFDDGEKFDKRFLESIKPALDSCKVRIRRADEILGVEPIIDKVEREIKNADICIAEVSLDNPNVWLELGYALALDKPTIILCDKTLRERLPFDIQHRTIIFYLPETKSGFEKFERDIAQFVLNEISILEKKPLIERSTEISEAIKIDNINGNDICVLRILISKWISGPIRSYDLEKESKKFRLSPDGLGLSVSKLIKNRFIEDVEIEDESGFEHYIIKAYSITESGIEWLQRNEIKILEFQAQESKPKEDDLPF